MHLTSPRPAACALSSFFITIYRPPLPLSLPHPPVSYQTFSFHYIVIPNDRVSGFVKLSLGASIMLSLVYNFLPNCIQGVQGIFIRIRHFGKRRTRRRDVIGHLLFGKRST
jgi:hypothetical protein